MKILVIGSGFLATELVLKLESEGHEILIFTRTPNAHIQSQQILGDVFDFEGFVKIFGWKPQIIIHTAWVTTPGKYKSDLSNFRYAEFTTKLAKFVVNSDLEHFIILGTCAEYGLQSAPSRAGYTKLVPTTIYAQQKVAALNSVIEVMRDSNVRLTWARIFHPYGPNQDQRRLIPLLIESLKNREPIILADTTSEYDWISTRDISSAISWTIRNKLPVEIDIGTSFGFTNLEIVKTLEELMQIEFPQPPRGNHNLGPSEVFIADKNSAIFTSGWLPEDSLTSGLEWVLGT
jgi:nucleoside-diphosphate-sugar epimerase